MIDQLRRAIEATGLDVQEVTFESETNSKHTTKSYGTKHVSRLRATLTDGTTRDYVVKRIREDGAQVNEGEGVITLYRLGRFDANALSVWLFDRQADSGFALGIGSPREVLLLEPYYDAPLLAELILEDEIPRVEPAALGRRLGEYLQAKHAPADVKLYQYVRELVGGSFGLLATLDAYPNGILSTEDYLAAAQFAARWTIRLSRGHAVRVHGDFHPWNVFVNPKHHAISTTGGLHTSYGLAEDDIACMSINLRLMENAQDLLAAFLAASQSHSDVFGFFLGWRLLILANPRHYPERSEISRRSLIRAALFALAGEGLETRLGSLLEQLLGHTDPWIKMAVPLARRTGSPIHATAAHGDIQHVNSEELARLQGRQVSVGGRIRRLRAMKHVVFLDLELEGLLQVAIPRSIFPDLPRVRARDLIGVHGIAGKARSGDSCVFAQEVRWWHRCELPPVQARSELHLQTRYESLSTVLHEARDILHRTGFAEIVTDTMGPSYQGGRARPFWTWSDSQRRRLYLRVTSELALKGALARGMRRVYEIGPMYRNEAEDGRHLPEFLMLEAYAALGSLDDAVNLVCEIVRKAAHAADLSAIRRLRFHEAFLEYLALDIHHQPEVASYCDARSIRWPPDHEGRLAVLHRILRRHIAPLSRGILVVDDLPGRQTPTVRVEDGLHVRSWVFANGVSVADVTREETAPLLVAHRFKRQFADDRHPVERDYRGFMKTMHLGLPPCVGFGMSLSRVMQVSQGLDSIRRIKLPA